MPPIEDFSKNNQICSSSFDNATLSKIDSDVLGRILHAVVEDFKSGHIAPGRGIVDERIHHAQFTPSMQQVEATVDCGGGKSVQLFLEQHYGPPRMGSDVTKKLTGP
jgi:hypothetical protein